ncbi:MAG TPA: SMP-30/gluconolactonase/LRE family protein [Candidatus Brocadiia bacterium]|nr:SMP-30/gluconolactonase/LRE family protein [Candidatus Brocadiia bacterium]
MKPELIADYQCQCGEGPLWHPMQKKVYWVDIPKGRLFRYEPSTGKHEQCFESRQIGGFTVQADGKLLLFMDKGTVATWDEGKFNVLIEDIPDERQTRFNDVISDPEGRVFCGTMPAPGRLGRLYRLDQEGRLTILLEGIGCSNGMGFTPDRKGLYYTDSPKKEIYLFDYDRSTGALSNQRVFAKVPEDEGVPDGMTVDAAGRVWSARWDGSRLVRYDAKGNVDTRIDFPAKKVSSVIFGGEDYSDMYVTTAGGQNKAQEGDGAGALFRVRAGVKGVAEFLSKVML